MAVGFQTTYSLVHRNNIVLQTPSAGMTEELRFAVIKEAVLRDVVCMLDPTGASLPEFAVH